MRGRERNGLRAWLHALVAPEGDPYEGADIGASRKATAALLGLSGLLTLLLLPIDHPTDALGGAGWAVATGLALVNLAAVPLVLDDRRGVGFDGMLAVAYLGIAEVAVLDWLAGPSSSYAVLLVLWLGAGAVHPARRALPFIGVLVAAMALPLAYEGWEAETARRIAAHALLVVAIGLVLVAYLAHVRRQRIRLRAGAEVARRLAGTDPLTGLGNRRAFDEALIVELGRAERDGVPLAVALLDLDNLRRINDRYGHLEGDRCLAEAARALETCLREDDRCFRWGGDEFALLLPDTDTDTARGILERVVSGVGEACAERGLALSYGLTAHSPGRSAEDVLAAADIDLMERKTEKRR